MKRLLAAIVLLLLWAPAGRAEESLLTRLEKEIRSIAERAAPAVVKVSVEVKVSMERSVPLPAPGGPEKAAGRPVVLRSRRVGTGFVVGGGDLVLTTRRIVGEAERARVAFRGGVSRDARVLGTDRLFHLAVLSIDPVPGVEPLALDEEEHPAGSLGIFLGHSYGQEMSISLAVVTGVRRRTGPDDRYDNYLLLNTPIRPGDVGGPVLDARGRVMGMGVGSFAGAFRLVSAGGAGGVRIRGLDGSEGLGAAIHARDLAYALREIREHGRVRHGYMGVLLRPGALEIANVLEHSPAARAGLRPGDVLLAVGEDPLAGAEDLGFRLLRTPAGVTLTFRVRRGETTVRVPCLLGERPAPPLVVRSVDLRWAACGLRPGDVVLAVNGKKVDSRVELGRLLSSRKDAAIRLRIRRAEKELDIVLPPAGR